MRISIKILLTTYSHDHKAVAKVTIYPKTTTNITTTNSSIKMLLAITPQKSLFA